MIRPPKPIPFILLVLACLVSLQGCGGGGGSQSAPTIDTQLFVPNYIASLDHLLHWNHVPAKIYFDLPPEWNNLFPSHTDIYVQAANEWNITGQQQLLEVVPTRATADITVSFTYGVLNNDPAQAGYTNYTYYSDSLRMSTAAVTVRLDRDGGGLRSWGETQMVIAHELGHGLGIGGHSPNPADLMYATSSIIVSAGTRDLNTIETAYASYFTVRALSVGPSPVGTETSEPVTEVIE